MRSGLRRALFMTGLGAGAGALAAIVGYAFRKPERLNVVDLSLSMKVDDLTLSDELWAIVGLTLLGALVCGSLAMAAAARKGRGRALGAGLVAAPLGAIGCWGSRWLMDQMIYWMIGPPDATIDALQASLTILVPFIVWQVGVALGLTMPITIGIGANRFTFLRGLIGAGFVIVFGQVIGSAAGVLIALVMVGSFVVNGADAANATNYGRVADVMYLFAMGAGAGLAFAVAEAIYKPAWLTSRYGATEGRKWTLNGPVARIGSFEGNEVYLPPDGTLAPVHAQVHAAEDAHYVADLAGGTYVNGLLVQTQWLSDGDEIGVGSVRLLYRTRLDAPVANKEAPRATIAPHAPPKAVSFVLVDSMGNRHPLRQGANTVGRDPSCDIVLTWEQSVSRRHAEITVSQSGVTVNDLGSTNGTFVDGARIASSAVVTVATVIRLGKAGVVLSEA